jgi:hypothetical protein
MNAAVSALRFVFSVTLGRRKAAASMAGGSPRRTSRR